MHHTDSLVSGTMIGLRLFWKNPDEKEQYYIMFWRTKYNIYIEYQTQNSGRSGRGTTWYNPRTNREYSSYPPSLLTLKIGKSKKRTACQTSVLPHLDKMFTLQCTQCLNKHSSGSGDKEQEKTGQCKDATVFCVDCEESFCEECYDNR